MSLASYHYEGGCHCGNIKLIVALPKDISSYKPRVCDCTFCQIHGASYLSDTKGQLMIIIKDNDHLSRYRQGDSMADFLICTKCGVVAGVSYESNDNRYATINVKALSHHTECQPEVPVSPKLLSKDEKVVRWKSAWFSDVKIEVNTE